MDGIEVLERIRRNPALESVVIMMLTSSDQVERAALCRKMGVETYLIKPISSSDLLGSIRLAIGVPMPASTVTPAAEVSGSSLRILLAEDNLVNQKVAMGMLGKMGHKVTLAKNGLEALEQWRQSNFDLILMDVQMPEITACTALKIEREEIIRVLHEEHAFSDLFLKFLLARSMRTQADLVDQLFNSSEKRLARILLLLAEFGKPGEPEPLIPEITQETLTEMIGTTRSRVSFFMNRFRELGFIEYNGRIRVHRSLLNVVLHD
jgi:CheY-like chemotaxis protein